MQRDFAGFDPVLDAANLEQYAIQFILDNDPQRSRETTAR